MFKTPLFGKDSSPSYTAPRLSGICTAILCFIFTLIVFIVPPPAKKPKYETVRIVLDTTPVKKTISEESASSSGSPAIQEETPAVSETPAAQEAPAPAPVKKPEPAVKPVEPAPKQEVMKKSEPKPAPKKTETQAASKPAPAPAKTEAPKKEEPKYTKRTDTALKKSVEEVMAENQAAKASKSTTASSDPWAQFDDAPFEAAEQKTTQNVQKRVENALSGSAATKAEKATQSSSSTESSSSASNVQTSADSGTTSALAKIGDTKFVTRSYSGSNSTSAIKTGSNSSGDVSVEMTDGSSRMLIKPRKPSISISQENAGLIGDNTTVLIYFTVLSDGSVPENSIQISPKILPSEIVEEIVFQLSYWKFEPGRTNSNASFDFTILKK